MWIWINCNDPKNAGLIFPGAKLNCKKYFLPEITQEQEEPDSAFEATQYFFEDITPETSISKDQVIFIYSIYSLLFLDTVCKIAPLVLMRLQSIKYYTSH